MITYDSGNFEPDEYTVGSSSFSSEAQIEVQQLELITNLSDNEVWSSQTIEGQIETSLGNREIQIELRNESGSLVAEESIHITDARSGNFSLDPQKPGKYSVVTTDIYSQTVFSTSVQVISPEPPTVDTRQAEYARGQFIPIDLVASSDANTTDLTVTGPNGTVATVTLTTPRAEQTTLRFNTYAAGDPAYVGDLVSLEGPGTIESVTTSTIEGPLPPGEYTITATAAPGGPTDTATTTLHDRSTDALSVYTTADADSDAFTSAPAVKEAIADGTFTRTETVTEEETVVYAIDASGLAGYVAIDGDGLATGADLDALDGLGFAVSTAPQDDTEPTTVATAAGTAVFSHETGLFLVGNASDTLGEPEGQELVATFDVVDGRLRAAAESDSDGAHAVSAPMSYTTTTDSLDETGESEEESSGETDIIDGSGGGGEDTGSESVEDSNAGSEEDTTETGEEDNMNNEEEDTVGTDGVTDGSGGETEEGGGDESSGDGGDSSSDGGGGSSGGDGGGSGGGGGSSSDGGGSGGGGGGGGGSSSGGGGSGGGGGSSGGGGGSSSGGGSSGGGSSSSGRTSSSSSSSDTDEGDVDADTAAEGGEPPVNEPDAESVTGGRSSRSSVDPTTVGDEEAAGDGSDASAAGDDATAETTPRGASVGGDADRLPGLDDAPLRSTIYDVPAFGVGVVALTLAFAVGIAVWRRGG